MDETTPQTLSDKNSPASIAGLFALLGDADPLVVQEQTPDELAAATEYLDDKPLRTPERDGKWSIIEVAQHLADTELALSVRIRKMLAEQPDPDLFAYDQDKWAAGLRYREMSLQDALMQLRLLRAANLRLMRSATPEQMEQGGIHPERGRESLQYTARLYAGHDLYHLGQIARIKGAIGVE